MNLKARLKTLERQRSKISREPFRLVTCFAGKPLDRSKATCTRIISPDGQLMVNLHGGDYGLSDEDLETFIQSFPIERR